MSDLHCKNHKNKIAEIYCKICSVGLCQKCNKYIHSIEIYKNHERVSMNTTTIDVNNNNMEDEDDNGKEQLITKEDFEIGKKLNEGQESIVYEGKFNKTACVIKKSKKDSSMDYIKEIKLLKRTIHPNIAQCLGAYIDSENKNEIIIFYEKLEPSENHILLNRGSNITDLQRIKYVHQLALGFAFLEGQKILHGDIKLANTLYDRNADKLKICDFGFARDTTRNIHGVAKGSPLYLAPEIWETLLSNIGKTNVIEYNFKMDVYSFSLLVHCILTGIDYTSPINDLRTLAYQVTKNLIRPDLNLLNKYPSSLKNVISKCWISDPNERYSFSDCVKYFNDIFLEMTMPVLPIPNSLEGESKGLSKVYSENLRKWLSKYFKSEEETQTKIFSVEFPEFIQKFCRDFFNLNVPSPGDDFYKLLEFLFKKRNQNQLDLDAFSEYMPCFGPLDDGNIWKEKVKKDVLLPGFYGRITKKEAEQYLLNAKPRQFLLRCSSTKGNWTVSICCGEQKVYHIMIDHAPFEDLYSITLNKKIHKFPTLTQALEFIATNFQLIGFVLIYPPNTRIFIDERQEISKYANYISNLNL